MKTENGIEVDIDISGLKTKKSHGWLAELFVYSPGMISYWLTYGDEKVCQINKEQYDDMRNLLFKAADK